MFYAALLTLFVFDAYASTSVPASDFLANLRNNKVNDSGYVDGASRVVFESHDRPHFEANHFYETACVLLSLAIVSYVSRIVVLARRRYVGHCDIAVPLDYALQKKLIQ